jgi:hypothetical protein
MKQNQTKIWSYADWDFLEESHLMGFLTSQRVRFGWWVLNSI